MFGSRIFKDEKHNAYHVFELAFHKFVSNEISKRSLEEYYLKGKYRVHELIKVIVVDEAQVLIDDALPRFSSSKTRMNDHRGIFSPIKKAMNGILFNVKLLASGTGLSISKIVDATGSPIKEERIVNVFGVVRHFEAEEVCSTLKAWGVENLSLLNASAFVGRPRFAAYLAKNSIASGKLPNDVINSTRDNFVKLLGESFKKARLAQVPLNVSQKPTGQMLLQRDSSEEIEPTPQSLLGALELACFDYAMGGGMVILDRKR